jgi:hypothetical protein
MASSYTDAGFEIIAAGRSSPRRAVEASWRAGNKA